MRGDVCISGYFDPVHEGHLSHITEAKALGGRLVAIVPTDSLILRFKHHEPFHSQDGRMRLLCALGVDDCVHNVDTDGTCAETLKLLKPSIFAKGAEYSIVTLPDKERQVCEANDIQMVFGVGRRLNRSSKWTQP